MVHRSSQTIFHGLCQLRTKSISQKFPCSVRSNCSYLLSPGASLRHNAHMCRKAGPSRSEARQLCCPAAAWAGGWLLVRSWNWGQIGAESCEPEVGVLEGKSSRAIETTSLIYVWEDRVGLKNGGGGKRRQGWVVQLQSKNQGMYPSLRFKGAQVPRGNSNQTESTSL
jgi:hypothetical protein